MVRPAAVPAAVAVARRPGGGGPREAACVLYPRVNLPVVIVSLAAVALLGALLVLAALALPGWAAAGMLGGGAWAGAQARLQSGR